MPTGDERGRGPTPPNDPEPKGAHVQEGISDAVIRRFFELSEDLCAVTDLDGTLRYANPAWNAVLGRDPQGVVGLHLSAFLDRRDWRKTDTASRIAIGEGGLRRFENRFLHHDGTPRWIQWNILIDREEGLAYGIGRETTERHIAEEALATSRARQALQAAAMEAAANAIVITDRDGVIEWVNGAFTTITGYAADEVVGNKPSVLKSGEHDPGFYADMWETILSGRVWRGEVVNRRKDGTHYSEEQTITPVVDAAGAVIHFIAIKQDVTEKMAASRRLAESEERYRMLAENAADVVFKLCFVPNLKFDYVSPSAFALTGFSPEEHYADPSIFFRVVHPEDRQQLMDMTSGGQPILSTMRFVHRDGRILHVEQHSRPIFGADGELEGVEGILRDVTQRTRQQELSEALNARVETQLRRFQALHKLDTSILLDLTLEQVLDIALEDLRSELRVDASAVFYLDEDTRLLRLLADRNLGASVRTIPLGRGIAGEVLQTRAITSIPDIQANDEHDRTYMDRAGFRGCLAVPLQAVGRLDGVLEVFTREPMELDADAQVFAEAIAHQLSLAIQREKLLEDLRNANDHLEEAYDRTIEGWATALDLRDEETAGHSQRVADTTVHLARRLGVPEAEVHHLRRGALLHDIGKMGIPDSILLKPGRLTAEEFEVVKRHPMHAHDMLKEIPYLQGALAIPTYHHERWDGSGYPEGLAGEAIPLAARIFAVIDVFDALTSDRPYRPAWSAENALAHLAEGAGRHFDPAVVDAFLELVTERVRRS